MQQKTNITYSKKHIYTTLLTSLNNVKQME